MLNVMQSKLFYWEIQNDKTGSRISVIIPEERINRHLTTIIAHAESRYWNQERYLKKYKKHTEAKKKASIQILYKFSNSISWISHMNLFKFVSKDLILMA